MDKIKILVVDDESRMRKLVKDFLEREGFEVLEAGDGMEAMEIFYEEKEIALIIVDRKSGMNCRDLISGLMNIFPNRSARRSSLPV